MKDILQDNNLRQMPYSTPDGYFEGLKAGLKMIPVREKSGTRVLRKVVRYTAIAASVALLFTAGRFIFGKLAGADEFTEEDYIVFSDEMTNAIYQESYTEQYASTQKLTEEDLIEYRIDIGVEIEELEQL